MKIFFNKKIIIIFLIIKMSNIEEKIDNNSLSIKDELERKLYFIKKNNYIFNDKFKEEFKFVFSLISKDKDENNVLILLNNEKYLIEKESRIIDFIIDGQIIKKFIYSYNYLKKVFKSLKIEYYSSKNEKLDDSLDSEISEEEILNIFKNENIKTIYKINSTEDEIIDKFKNRHPEKLKIISDLSLNASYYNPLNCNNNLDIDIFNKYVNAMKDFIFTDKRKIIYLIGPKGTSKSLFLMYYSLLLNFQNYPTLYINYKIMNKLELNERKNIFKKEMLYLFSEEDKLREFYKHKHHRIIKFQNNFLFCLKKFLEIIIKGDIFDNKITLIIDNFE